MTSWHDALRTSSPNKILSILTNFPFKLDLAFLSRKLRFDSISDVMRFDMFCRALSANFLLGGRPYERLCISVPAANASGNG